jgi:hypothetical protein
VEVSLVAALGASPAKAASSLQHVAAKLRERPDVVARVDRIRLARIERARQLPFGSALLPLELELLGVLARCRSPNAKAEGPEFLAKQTELLEFVLASLEENMWTDTLTVATGISVLVALEAAELPFSEAADLSARKLADALLGSARYNTVTRDQYLAGLVAMARLDVGLEHCHLLLFMANNPFPPGRAWLGKQTSDPVRLAVQSLIQTRPSDAPRNRRALLELLEGPAPAWGPRLRARVLGMLSYGDSPALAVERLQEARELDPRWPWAQGALGKAQLAAGDPALALASAERAVALQHEMGFDLRPGTRWETPWLRVNVVQALVRLKRYEDAAKKLDALLVDHAELPALVSLQKAGVFRLLEEKLGRTFDWEPVPLPRDGRR